MGRSGSSGAGQAAGQGEGEQGEQGTPTKDAKGAQSNPHAVHVFFNRFSSAPVPIVVCLSFETKEYQKISLKP